jgi:hypothetical protein
MGIVTKFTFGNKYSRGSCRKRHCHKPWFDANYYIAKRELKLYLKANPDSHVVSHQENKLKNVLKNKIKVLGKCKSSTYVYACQGVYVLILEKVLAMGTCCGQNQCNYAFGKLLQTSWPIFATHKALN